MVLARYDLKRTWTDLLIAASVPSILFVISFIALCVIMQSVKVGDDTKMRCKYCVSKNDNDLCEMATRQHYDEPTSPAEEISRRDKEPLVKE